MFIVDSIEFGSVLSVEPVAIELCYQEETNTWWWQTYISGDSCLIEKDTPRGPFDSLTLAKTNVRLAFSTYLELKSCFWCCEAVLVGDYDAHLDSCEKHYA